MSGSQTFAIGVAVSVMVREDVRCGCVTRVGCIRKISSTANGFVRIQ